MTEETRHKISQAKLGKKHTIETKQKIGKIKSGVAWTDKQKQSKRLKMGCNQIKLTEAEITFLEIKKEKYGMSYKQIAAEIGVSHQLFAKIKGGCGGSKDENVLKIKKWIKKEFISERKKNE